MNFNGFQGDPRPTLLPDAPSKPPIIPVVPRAQIVQQATRQEFNAVAKSPAERQETISGVNELLPLGFGTDRVGAKVTAAVVSGIDLYLRAEWHGGEIDGFNQILIDNAAPVSGVDIANYTGAQVTADSQLVSAFSANSITYADTLNGIAYSRLKCPAGTSKGFPRPVAELRLTKCQTTSGGTYIYTTNPVWHIGYLLKDVLGYSLNWSSFATAATDACDVLVGAEKKREIGITFSTEIDVWAAIKLLLGYAGCYLWYDNGAYGLTAETATTPTVMQITEALMKNGEINVQSRNTQNSPTVVRVWYTERGSTGWIESYAEAVAPGVGTTLPYVLSEIRMPGIFRFSHANREAIERLNEFILNDIAINFVTRDQGLKILPGDIIEVTHSVGFSSKKFRVERSEPVELGRYSIDAKEFDPAKYSSVVATAPTFADTNLPSPSNPPTVGAITLTESISTAPSGAIPLSVINASWASIVWPFLASYRVVVKDAAGLIVDQGTANNTAGTTTFQSKPLPAFSTYTVEARARSTVAESATASTASISLASSGVSALATVYALQITRAELPSWSLDGIEAYESYVGDNVLRLRTPSANEPAESSIYTGGNMLIPGRATQLLDADRTVGTVFLDSWIATSPVYDMQSQRTAVYALLNISKWAQNYFKRLRITVQVSANASMVPSRSVDLENAILTGRYVRITLSTFSASGRRFFWAISFENASVAQLMPTVSDVVAATSSATGAVVVQLPRRYIAITGVNVTAQSALQANPSYSNILFSETEVSGNSVQIRCFDAFNALIAVPCTVEVTGVPA